MRGGSIQKKTWFSCLVLSVFLAGMATNGTCTVIPPQVAKTPCKKSRLFVDEIKKPVSSTCHMLPCHARDVTLFTLSGAPSRRLQDEQRHLSPDMESTPSFILVGCRLPNWVEDALGRPSSTASPPLFILHCTIIC